ncbi:MAG: Ig-like domain-containing protein, partial [bacterium]|nr:Ig-like domain-containing protein [bacterium]
MAPRVPSSWRQIGIVAIALAVVGSGWFFAADILAAAPTVSSSSPASAATQVAVDAAVTVTFSAAMDADTALGAQWTQQGSTTGGNVVDITIPDASIVYAATDGGGGATKGIWKSTDYGVTWARMYTLTGSDRAFGIACVSTTVCWAVGASGLVIATTNGGTTWAAQTSGTVEDLNDVFAVDANTVYALGQSSTVIKTTNGGTTWSSVGGAAAFGGANFGIWGSAFVSTETGWV